MNNKLIKIALVGKTNAGKSTLINSIVGEKISIINKKINTTQELILGIKNINNVQIIFYDTPGSNFLKTSDINQKKLKLNIWQAIDSVDTIVYLIDILKYNFDEIKKDLEKIHEVKKPIIFIFNKVDLFDNKNILPLITNLKTINKIKDFFLLSAKYNQGIDVFLKYLNLNAKKNEWLYKDDEITDKDDIYISNECTRNSLLNFLHKEIPYKIKVKNELFKYLKNSDLKIKQIIELSNLRYKPIILGKNGNTIKKIREKSQSEIASIVKCKVHLYLKVEITNEK